MDNSSRQEPKNSAIYCEKCTWHPLQEGDNITIIKDLKIKRSSSALKVGMKVKNICLVDEVNGDNIEAKVPGFGLMILKSEIVKEFFSDTAIIHSPLGQFKSPQEMVETVDKWITAIPDNKVDLLNTLEDNGIVVSHWKAL